MRIFKRAILVWVILINVSCASNKGIRSFLSSQNDTSNLTTLNFSVEEAPEWNEIFKRTSGWIGADGIYSIPLNGSDASSINGDSTLLLFSDTNIGEIKQGKITEGYKMINNTVAYIEGIKTPKEQVKFYWDKDISGNPESLFIPYTLNSRPGDYYWLGDGFVNSAKGNATYIFAYRIRNIKTTGAFGFEQTGNTLIILPKGSKPPFKDQRQIDAPLFLMGSDGRGHGTFGSAVFVNTKPSGAKYPDGYIYVYGIEGEQKSVIVARVKPGDIEEFPKWRFWDGKRWNKDMSKVAAIANRASNELSVTPLPDGRYAMIFQTDGIGKTVGLRLGKSPIGPFGPIITIYDCSKVLSKDKNFFAYNAKAHPNLSGTGELLISYNVNSFDFFNDLKKYPDFYRPRFIKIRLH